MQPEMPGGLHPRIVPPQIHELLVALNRNRFSWREAGADCQRRTM